MPYTCLPLLLGKVVIFHCTDTVEIDIISNLQHIQHECLNLLECLYELLGKLPFAAYAMNDTALLERSIPDSNTIKVKCCRCQRPINHKEVHKAHQAFRRKHIGEIDQWLRQQRVNCCKHFGSPKEWNVMLLPWCLRPICWGIYMSGGGGGCFWCTPERGPLCTSFYVRRVTLGCRWYMAADSQGDRKGQPMFEDDN